MRLVQSFALALTISLTSVSAFADIIDPDAGMADAGSTNGATNNATNNSTTGASNNTPTSNSNNGTTSGNNGTGGPTGGDTTSQESTTKDDDGGCSVASVNSAAPIAPLLLGLALLGLGRRRRA